MAKDVDSKIAILDKYYKEENNEDQYKTLQSMIEYEKQKNILKDDKRPSGARTLLRLHRALEFIALFMAQVRFSE